MKKSVLFLWICALAMLVALNTRAQNWAQLGSLSANSFITVMATDVSGNIYAAGSFTDGNNYYYVAKWNGTTWSELGTGASALNANGSIVCMTTDKSGNVYVAGGFTDANSKEYVAMWNGSTWTELGTGANALNANSYINNLAYDVHNKCLYAAGSFSDGLGSEYVAKWNGSTWSELGTVGSFRSMTRGITGVVADTSGHVYTDGYYQTGTGFNTVTTLTILEWNGTAWLPLGGTGSNEFSANSDIYAMTIDLAGNVYAGGAFTDGSSNPYIAKWNGSSWSELGGSGFSGAIENMTTDISGHVYALGTFEEGPTGHQNYYVAEYNGYWSALNSNNYNYYFQPTNMINAITTDTNDYVYVGGGFKGSNSKEQVEKWTIPPPCKTTKSFTYDTIYTGETFTWNGNNYSAAGNDTATLTNAGGCDSLSILVLTIQTSSYTNPYDWVWQSGSSVGYQTGTYGTIGVAASGNVPPSTEYAATWRDYAGNLWMFGGYTYNLTTSSEDSYNSLWKWDGAKWTWVNGSSSVNQPGVYGTKGQATASNVPGARYNAINWRDNSGNFWLFSGYGYDAFGNEGYLNDLWKWDGKQWTWMSGSDSASYSGIGYYGTKGTTSASNRPGGRQAGIAWADASGNGWIFGGDGFDAVGNYGILNDLWKWNGSQWTWMGGANTQEQMGIYGTQGVPSANNTPGSRTYAFTWADASGNLWLYGGQGRDGSNNEGLLSDLWKLNPATLQWTWVTGSQLAGQNSVYKVQGRSALNMPGGRVNGASWIDGSGNLWMFGGSGNASSSSGVTVVSGVLNDLWKWDGSQWTWVSGNPTLYINPGGGWGPPGVYSSIGTASATNVPGGREGCISWKDAHGNFWLFGGFGFNGVGNQAYMNDLWEYQLSTCTPTSSTTDITILSTSLPYTWNNSVYTGAGTDTLVLVNKSGCDSLAILHLTVQQVLANSPGDWVWVSGSNVYRQGSTYGTKGVAAATNMPGARAYCSTWKDNAGNFWLFGGEGNNFSTALNDLWKWDGTNWTWMGGSANQMSVYGTQGTAAAANTPGARDQTTSWTDAAGNLWLYGGAGTDANGSFSYLNELWEYNTTTNEWTWVSGSKYGNQSGNYGTKGTASGTNVPGARENPEEWTDASGNFWIFSGKGEDGSGNIGELNDLWKWDGTNWTWIYGSNTKNEAGVYGTKGVSSSTNLPGGRQAAATWQDASGNLWLFGGTGDDAFNTYASNLNDLWEWNGSQWTWMGGNNVNQQIGVYGTKGIAAAANLPSARSYTSTWQDASGNVWLFGGFGNGITNTGYLNDIWKWNGSQWAWMGGSKYIDTIGIYGTKGTPAASNTPGGRLAAGFWSDGSGNFWVFGGYGVDSADNIGELNDLWRYTPSTYTPCVITTSTIDTAICAGSSYSFHSKTFTTAGAHLDTLTNVGGCDSIVTINVTIKQPTTSTTNVSICPSALPYTWNGNNYTKAGRDTVYLTNKVGCDSVTILVLTVKQTSTSTTNISICPSALPYSWNSHSYSAAGRDTVHLTNKAGCDSVTILVLTLKLTSTSTTNVTVCANALPYRWNNTNYTASNNYTIHLTNKAGCDSAATLALAVTTPVTPAVSIIITPDSVITPGTSVKFTANVTNGGTAPKYQWKKNGIAIAGATGSTYSISTLVNKDAITCVLTSNATCVTTTTATSNKITMTVNSIPCPTVAAAPTPILTEVCSGSSVPFSSTAITGNATYKWQYTTGSAITVDSAWKTFGSNSNTATLTGIHQKTYARLVVTVPGCATVSSPTATVNVDSTALAVTASSITASSALLSWNSILGATYSITVNGHTYTSATNSYTVTGLTGCSSYTASVTATGGTCNTTPTGSIAFNTPAAKLAILFKAGAGGSLVVSWSAGKGPYKVYYGEQVAQQNLNVVTVTGTTYTIPAKSVASGATYIVYVVDAGSTCTPLAQSTYAYYNVPGGSCTGTAPVITTVTSTSTAFTINWTGAAAAYQVYYKNAGGNWVSYSTTANTYTISGAAPGTCYPYYVVNKCGTTFGWSSTIDTVCTPSECAGPLNLVLSQPTCKGFTATWNAATGAATYQVYCSVTTGSGTPNWMLSYAATNNIVFNIFGINTRVAVYVVSNCIVGGRSVASNVESITTLSTGCKDDNNAALPNGATTANAFSVYPNPNNGTFKVLMNTQATNTTATLDVMDVLGRLVYSTDVVNSNGTINESIDLGNMVSNGIYMVRVRCGNDTHIAKVEIQR